MNKPKRPSSTGRRRSTLVKQTNSGKSLKINRSISDRWKARKLARITRKAEYLSTLPKDRWKRILYRLHPKRVLKYWFSREGAIMALKLTGIGIVTMFLLILGMFAYFRKDLPKIKDLSGDRLGGSITYYDRTGQTELWQDYDAVKRVPIEDKAMPNNIKQATIAIEDKDFFKHGAFDVRGIMRAGINNAFGSGGTQGGSTITQQLVKLDQKWTNERTVTRKVKELILAVELERNYSKQEVLTGYLNVAPYGPVQYGVEIAANDYFGISAKDLNLAQSSLLAAIPKSPSVYSPYGPYYDKDALIGRQQYILKQMVAQKMISQKQADEAKKVDVLAQIKPQKPSKYEGIKAPYFVLAAKDELTKKYSEETVERGGWKVITTLDLNLQQLAEDSVQKNMFRVTSRGGDSAALVSEDVKTGQIVALVGNSDFNNKDFGELDFAHSVRVSPGSTFKPYDAAAIIDGNNNVGAGSVLSDTQGALPGYPCTNKRSPKIDKTADCLWDYDFRYPGPITLRYALGGSRNVPWVKAMMSSVPNDKSNGKVDSINKTIGVAKSLMNAPDGYACYAKGTDVFSATKDDEAQCYGSSAIGDGAYIKLDDHVNGFASLARLGTAIPRTYILKITNGSGKIVDQYQQPKGKQAVKPDTAYIVDDMASDPNASYLNGANKFHRNGGWHYAIKTGTTNDSYDGLMASWTTQYATVVWVGHHTRNVAMKPYMEDMTGPMMRNFMLGAHEGKTPVNWQAPAGLKTLPAFVVRSKVSNGLGEVVPSSSTDLFPSWYAGGNKGTTTSQTLDKVSNKVATSCTPELAKDVQFNSNVATWNVDIFNGGKASIGSTTTTTKNTAPAATDDIHNCNDTQPLISVSVAGNVCNITCKVTLTASRQGGGHPLSGGPYTTAPASTVSVKLGDQVIGSVTIPSDSQDVYSYSFDYNPPSNQTANLTAIVVDSVLYQGTATSDPINFTIPVAPVIIPLSYSGSTGNPLTTISWLGGTGPYTVYKGAVPVSADCTAKNGTSCTAPYAVVHGNLLTIKDSSTPQQTTSGTP